VEAPNVHVEAKTIALILRQALEIPERQASLVTPDRDLARRVKQELLGFGVEIDDSAGEPLSRFDGAALLHQLIDTAIGGFAGDKLVALLKQTLCNFGLAGEQANRAVNILEIAVYRMSHLNPGLDGLIDALRAARDEISSDDHPHPALQAVTDQDWQATLDFAVHVVSCLQRLPKDQTLDFSAQLDALVECGQAASGQRLWMGESGKTLLTLIQTLRSESAFIAPCSFERVAAILQHYLVTTPFRKTAASHSRLSILGLLEARLTKPDRMVLGGLNEGRWPALPDSGPWLNRPMRELLGMQQPEREIGQTAHDLAQAMRRLSHRGGFCGCKC
jgi:ATP-dependent helicase/nuclease subunit B